MCRSMNLRFKFEGGTNYSHAGSETSFTLCPISVGPAGVLILGVIPSLAPTVTRVKDARGTMEELVLEPRTHFKYP